MRKRVRFDIATPRDTTEASGFAGLLSTVQQATYRSLGWVALVVAGTAHFAAPEVAQGLIDQIDARADIYALGCVAFWLLTGRRVFEGETAMKVLVKHIHDEPDPPSRIVGAVAADMDRLVLDCLEKERDKRIGSADELAERLASISCSNPWTPSRSRHWWESSLRSP